MPEAAVDHLVAFAKGLNEDGLPVLNAVGRLDENLHGEPVVRLTVLLEDPAGDTWELEALDGLQARLQAEATRRELPWVSLTLVARSEANLVDAFSRAY